MDYIYAIILGIIEGITEFLPISSTAHLLIASELLTYFNHSSFLADKGVRATFDIVIQLGPILAILVYFRADLWDKLRHLPSDPKTQRFWINLLIAFIPAGVVGLLLGKLIESPTLIAAALIIGGILFILIDQDGRPASVTDLYQITPVQALGIGIAQIAGLIPGASRSGATIIGGLLLGLDRKVATTFTFYLAIPTLMIATLYSLYKAVRDHQLSSSGIGLLAVGTLVAFVFAYAAIGWFLRYVSTHNFRAFGIYRIVAGLLILALVVFTTLLSN